ncbi:MAG TPA: ROK family protein [Puia sp.]|nr:ROK family protein [Puia sp.]
MAVLTIDFGGTRVKFGIIGEGGKIVAVDQVKALPESSIEDNLKMITQQSLLSFKEHFSSHSLSGVGIALPSIIDTESNKVVSRYVKYTSALDFDFNDWAKREWGAPLALENDARAALVGEWQYGAGKGCNDIVLLTLGTGVGSAVLVGGKLFKGKHLLAGSMAGHISINVNGDPCNCGFFGCLEREASTWALPSIIEKHLHLTESSLSKIASPQYSHLFEEAEKGDALATSLLDQSLRAWGTGVVNLIHAYDPEMIIIGGGIMRQEQKILPYIQRMVDRYAWLPPGTTRLTAAIQVDYAGLLGMEYLTHNLNKPTN